MILKASQRTGAIALANHLLNERDNERVEVFEVKGFISSDVREAMKESQTISLGTKCKQHLFSVSLSPPETAAAPVAAFERAIAQIEEKCGLSGQPRIVIFHEKAARRHCHVVWSRIDVETMTAVPLPFFKMKLREASRQIYFEQGWRMPAGLMDSKLRDPRNFDLAEWQQAARSGRDPREIKGAIQECWATSDTEAAFGHALESRGLYLARGDSRGHVIVTFEGEVHSLARVIGRTAKEVRARLGDGKNLQTVDEAKAFIASAVRPKLKEFIGRADERRAGDLLELASKRRAMRDHHSTERRRLDERQAERRTIEMRKRNARLRPGLRGLWDRMSGERSRVLRENERDSFEAFLRDRTQRDRLVSAQLAEQRALETQFRRVRHIYAATLLGLHRDLKRLDASASLPQRGRGRGSEGRGTRRRERGLEH